MEVLWGAAAASGPTAGRVGTNKLRGNRFPQLENVVEYAVENVFPVGEKTKTVQLVVDLSEHFQQPIMESPLENESSEKKGLDRVVITLPGKQQLLVSEVTSVAKGPVILVIMSGGGMHVKFAKEDPKITSILWVGFPGEAGGAAMADVIFGRYNPSGRLPMTWYPQSYVENVNMTNMHMRANPTTGYPGRTYRFYKGETVFSFGDGLSYSQFSHQLVSAPDLV